MEKKEKSKFKQFIYVIIPLLSFMSVAVMATYAFYLATVVGNENNGNVTMKSAQVYAAFSSDNDFVIESMLPGYSGEIEFSIINTTKEENVYGNYTLAWDIKTNEIDSEYFTYTLEGKSFKDGKEIELSESNKLVNVSSPLEIPTVSANIGTATINTGVVHKYVLKINFKESGENQNDFIDKKFEGKIIAKGDPNI